MNKKNNLNQKKSSLHPRSFHKGRYAFDLLVEAHPPLEVYVSVNQYGDESIDFFNPTAVKELNKALLYFFYEVTFWDIPSGYLCPPIPGRMDYLHYAADLLALANKGEIPKGSAVKVLDIGVGANCIYPILGAKVYGWSFVGVDCNQEALASAQTIVDRNDWLTSLVILRQQMSSKDILHGIVKPEDRFELLVCNPPFHSSPIEAEKAASQKLNNLKGKKVKKTVLNFGGKHAELWCEGGEAWFSSVTINQSAVYQDNFLWFTTLVSKNDYLESLYDQLALIGAKMVKTIAMGQGNKISRILCWTFHDEDAQSTWFARKRN